MKPALLTPVVGPGKGALVIMGGGGKDRSFEQIFGKFVELAGGTDAWIVQDFIAKECQILRNLCALFSV